MLMIGGHGGNRDEAESQSEVVGWGLVGLC